MPAFCDRPIGLAHQRSSSPVGSASLLTSSQNQHAELVARRDFQQRRASSARTSRARSCSAARTGTCPADRSGRAAGRGSAPASPCAARRAAGSTSSGRPCTGAAGWRRSLRCEAVSTMCPAYMTWTRSAMPATTPRSWVIMITPVPRSVCSVAHQVEDLGLDRHVERGRRLVGDQQLRVAGERHRDHHALAHTAGELVRVLVDALLGVRDADHLAAARSSALRAWSLFIPMCSCERLADLPVDRQHRVERGHRVLEDHRDLVAADRADLARRSS